MRIHTHRAIALHSASQGIINIPAKQTKNVPEDVNDHPQIKMLKKGNYISILKDKPEDDETEKPETEIPHDEEEADDEEDVEEIPGTKTEPEAKVEVAEKTPVAVR
jgi:hypothetical protein